MMLRLIFWQIWYYYSSYITSATLEILGKNCFTWFPKYSLEKVNFKGSSFLHLAIINFVQTFMQVVDWVYSTHALKCVLPFLVVFCAIRPVSIIYASLIHILHSWKLKLDNFAMQKFFMILGKNCLVIYTILCAADNLIDKYQKL